MLIPVFEQIDIKLSKNHKIGFSREKFKVPRRSPVNSKLVTAARNFFAAGLRVYQSKLLGMGIRYQLPLNFCTGGLKVAKILFFAESGAIWRAKYYRCSECL